MRIEERDDFVDVLAQAVIDKITEQDRITGMVNMVVARVLELQKQESELNAAKQTADGTTESHETPNETGGVGKHGGA